MLSLKSVLTISSGVNICNFGGMTNLGSPENFDPLSRVKNQCLVPGLPCIMAKKGLKMGFGSVKSKFQRWQADPSKQ